MAKWSSEMTSERKEEDTQSPIGVQSTNIDPKFVVFAPSLTRSFQGPSARGVASVSYVMSAEHYNSGL